MQFQSIRQELIATFDPEVIGLAPVPAAPSGESRGQVNGESFGVFSQTSPQQKLAAMRYVWFITGDDAKRRARTCT
jgi:ABC-type glycerol-3-phosphate transport system substrate-binding protein